MELVSLQEAIFLINLIKIKQQNTMFRLYKNGENPLR